MANFQPHAQKVLDAWKAVTLLIKVNSVCIQKSPN